MTRGNQALVYDEENRLVEVSNGTNVTRFGYADGGDRLWRSGTNGYSVWIGGIYEISNGKVLCHVFTGGQRVATFEPLCGGPWAKVVGEDQFYACTSALEKGLLWPFQDGRTPYTMLTMTLGGMLCVVLVSRRRINLKSYEVRKLWQTGLLWKQAVTFASIAALTLTTTQDAEATIYPTVFHYYHADHLGSSNVLTDRAGQRLQHYEYAAFGKATYTENASAFPISHRYTGQVLDEDTGLCYYNARYYDPELGRFVQADTIVPSEVNPQTLNRYAYCGNNPLKYVDPSGHVFGIDDAIIIGVIVGAAIGGATAAATGGNIGMGILCGAIGGLFGGVGAVAGSTIGGTAGGFAGAVAGGAAGGAVCAAVSGGDVGMGALTGAIGGAIGFGVGQLQIGMWGGTTPDSWINDLTGFASSAAGGAAGGGIGSVLQGGDFWDGAMAGAIGGAIGYAIAVDLPDAIRNTASDNPRFHLFMAAVTDAFAIAGAFLEGAGQGLAASIDGAIPFWDPLESLYSDNQVAVNFSKPVGGFGVQTLATAGAGAVAGKLINAGAKSLFLSENGGITSRLFANSAAGGPSGALNQAGNWFRAGWSNTGAKGGGYVFRAAFGSAKLDGPFLPNSVAAPRIITKQVISKLGGL